MVCREVDALPLSKARKQELVEEYVDLIERSRAIILTEYRGLNNVQLTQLRRAIREANGVYLVAKLTLLRLALEKTGRQIPPEMSGKPLAVGFCLEEVPAVAKAMTDFADNNDLFFISSALMENQVLSAKQVESIANLPPLDVVRAQIVGLLDAPAAGLVGIIQSGVSQIVNVLNAYVEQGQGGDSAAEAAAN
jgi:large subunit ribosomal protein L10